MLSPTTKILLPANELVNALKETSPLFTTSASSDHLAALKNLTTVFETAASSQPVLNTKNHPQPASVQLAPTHVPSTRPFYPWDNVPRSLHMADAHISRVLSCFNKFW